MIERMTQATVGRIVGDSERVETLDWVALEEPLEIRVEQGGLSRTLSITMRTPGHDEELAVGFLVGEGLLRDPAEVVSVGPCGGRMPHGGHNVVKVRVKEGVEIPWPSLERKVFTTSSCGLCGKASLEAVKVAARPLGAGPPVAVAVLQGLPGLLRQAQELFGATGGLHASGLFDAGGRLVGCREDVGRHNALDKLIGRAFLDGALPLSSSILFLSGRVSFELVQKAVVAGIPVIAAVGAPSSLAVELAGSAGATLVGFVRDGRLNVYHDQGRLLGEGVVV